MQGFSHFNHFKVEPCSVYEKVVISLFLGSKRLYFTLPLLKDTMVYKDNNC